MTNGKDAVATPEPSAACHASRLGTSKKLRSSAGCNVILLKYDCKLSGRALRLHNGYKRTGKGVSIIDDYELMCDALLGLFKTDGLPALVFASAAPACLDVTAGTLGKSQFRSKGDISFHSGNWRRGSESAGFWKLIAAGGVYSSTWR